MSSNCFNPDIEKMDPQQVRAMQTEKLGKQIQYLWANSALAKEQLESAGLGPDDVQSIEDLQKVPFLEKTQIRESQATHPPLGRHSCAPIEDVVRVHASSGTTGVPSYVGVTRADDADWTEAVARAYWSQGVRPNSIYAMGYGIGFFVGGVPLVNGISKIGATFLPIGTGATERLIESINFTEADCLACTPSYASYIAEYARTKLGIDAKSLGIKNLMVGAEPGGGIPQVRKKLEEEWGAKVTECIGNADVVPIHSSECEHQDGCHFLVPDQILMEIINPDTGEVIPHLEDGVEGEMVFTHLNRQCAPLLRFRSHDRVVVKTSPCPCGRTGPRIKVIGRTDDLLIIRGVNVWPAAIKEVVASLAPETNGEMRIVLDQEGHQIEPPLLIEVEANAGVDHAALKSRLEKELRAKLIFTANVVVKGPGSLPRYEMKSKLIHRINSDGNS